MRHSQSTDRNPQLVDWSERYASRSNLDFFADAYTALAKQGVGNGGLMTIGIVGQRDLPGYTLRNAQSILRWDRRPSLWSHAFLMNRRGKATLAALRNARILEVPLHPRTGEFPMPERNGILEGRLGHYDDTGIDANVGVLAVEMTDAEARRVQRRARSYNADRVRYDLWDTLGIWQAYLWSQGERPNPLAEDIPVASSSYVEMAFEEIALDLTPGALRRHSAPEHLWNAAVWWHDAMAEMGHPISGYYVLRNRACSLRSTDE